jgi:hypothetical protein
MLTKVDDTIKGFMRYIIILEYQYEGKIINQFFNSGEDKINIPKNRRQK